MPRKRSAESMDAQVAATQDRVVRSKERYDRACRDLEELLEVRDSLRRDELWASAKGYGRSYEEVLATVMALKGR